jgi:lipopolysaccharide transport system ATP-binding protein
MASVRQLCKSGVLLENGCVRTIGNISHVLETYMADADLDLGAIWKRPIDETKDMQVTKVELQSNDGNIASSYTCDEDIFIKIQFHVNNLVPHVYGYLRITRSDGTIVLVSDSNDIVNNQLERLPLGDSEVTIKIPKRTLGHGNYSLYLNFTANYNIGFNVDSPMTVCTFTIDDVSTIRGNARDGYLSTLLDWNIN